MDPLTIFDRCNKAGIHCSINPAPNHQFVVGAGNETTLVDTFVAGTTWLETQYAARPQTGRAGGGSAA